jgi:hypothetical protein
MLRRVVTVSALLLAFAACADAFSVGGSVPMRLRNQNKALSALRMSTEKGESQGKDVNSRRAIVGSKFCRMNFESSWSA